MSSTQAFMPGDVVIAAKDVAETAESTPGTQNIPSLRCGPGLVKNANGDFIATRAGILRRPIETYAYIASHVKRYVPARADLVLGVVSGRIDGGTSYKVDLGSAQYGTLGALEFENATKKTAPDLPVGAVVYARVIAAPKGLPVEVSCVQPSGKAEGLGPLRGGFMIPCCISLSHALVSASSSPVLAQLGRALAFEVAAGMNGRLWTCAPSEAEMVLIASTIIDSEFVQSAEMESFVRARLQRLGSRMAV